MAEYATYRGRGGGLHRFRLPLPPVFAAQEAKGYLVRVDEVAPPAKPPTVAEPAQPEPEHAQRPARVDPKADWVAYVVATAGLTEAQAMAMTKAELVEKYG